MSLNIPQEIHGIVCSDLQLNKVASYIVSWEEIASEFDFTSPEIEEIRRDNNGHYRLQKIDFLRRWKQKQGCKATVGQLVENLTMSGQADVAKSAMELIESTGTSSGRRIYVTNTAILKLKAHLKLCYQQQLPPCATSWPKSRTVNFVNPSLIRKEELGCSKTIKLKDVFTPGFSPDQRNVTLIEAPAGSGKSTLVWHINKLWANGILFQDYDLLIHVSLRDRTVQSATCLQDIIPHPNKEIRAVVANHVEKRGGEGIAFVMDGWDEIFSDIESSYVFDLVFGKASRCLPHAPIVIMSRPMSHSDLYSTITCKLAIEGFSPTEAKEYLSMHLSKKLAQVDLDKYLTENPLVVDLCNLPINAAIIAFILSNSIQHIPETRTGLFRLLVINLLLRHFQHRTEQHRNLRKLRDFNDLPQELGEKFTNLCNVAFIGVTEEESIFDSEHFEEHDVHIDEEADTFGLMQISLAISPFGESIQYSFLHQAIQGYLAALHMSFVGEGEQQVATEMLLRKNARNIVLPFFAGISKLDNPAIFEILIKAVLDPSDFLSSDLPDLTELRFDVAVSQRLLLLLLNCIYESKSIDLCLDAAEEIVSNSISSTISLTFYGDVLDPSDYIAIGYFLAHLSNHTIDLSLSWCNIRDTDLALLFRGLLGRTEYRSVHPLQLQLSFEGNEITHLGTQTLACLMQGSIAVVKTLNLFGNWSNQQSNTHLALKYLLEALARNSSLTSLNLSSCGITTVHALHLFLMLTCCCRGLQELDLSYNNLGDAGGCLLAIALSSDYCSLVCISLECCSISDDTLLAIGSSLDTNLSLKKLNISQNVFSDAAIITFQNQLQIHHHLHDLVHSFV